MAAATSSRAVAAAVGLGVVTVLLLTSSGSSGGAFTAGTPASAVAASSSPVHPGVAPPTVTFLGGLSQVVGATNATFNLTIEVPTGAAQVFVLWSIGGGLGAFTPPILPAGMSVATSYGFGGIAAGAPAAGTYTVSLNYAGFTNDVSMAAYAVSGGTDVTYQFANVNETNTDPGVLPVSAAVNLTTGGTTYLAVAGTGGYPLSSWSMTAVGEEAPAWSMGGVTQVIGSQPDGFVHATSYAEGIAVAGVGISSAAVPPNAPYLQLLATFSALVGETGATFTLNFTVPSDESNVLVAWAIGGGLAAFAPPVFPEGLSIVASVGSAGIAAGALAPGAYSVALSYPGFTNDVSLAAFGLANAPFYDVRGFSVSQMNPSPSHGAQTVDLSAKAGAIDYLGVVNTGGYGVASSSLTQIVTAAQAWNGTGETQYIGTQSSPQFSATSAANTTNLVSAGIYTNLTNVTVRESGLPAGKSWHVTVDNRSSVVSTSSVTLPAGRGLEDAFFITGPNGFVLSGSAATGDFRPAGSNYTLDVVFAHGRTTTLSIREAGLASGTAWCAAVGPWQQCGLGKVLKYPGLPGARYPYSIETFGGYEQVVRSGGEDLPTTGSISVVGHVAVSVRYSQEYEVEFEQSGAPSSTWSVTLGGVTKTAPSSAPILFFLTDGRYPFSPSSFAGYRAIESPTVVRVRNGPVVVFVAYLAVN